MQSMPSWVPGVVVSLFGFAAVVGALRMQVRHIELSQGKIEVAIQEQGVAIKADVAALAQTVIDVRLIQRDLTHATAALTEAEGEIKGLRQRCHDLANRLQVLELRTASSSSRPVSGT